jgi:hypothetical protein
MEEKMKQLKQIYRYYQLISLIPFEMTFEQFIVFMKELYGDC